GVADHHDFGRAHRAVGVIHVQVFIVGYVIRYDREHQYIRAVMDTTAVFFLGGWTEQDFGVVLVSMAFRAVIGALAILRQVGIGNNPPVGVYACTRAYVRRREQVFVVVA